MKKMKWMLFVVLAAMLVMLTACGSGSLEDSLEGRWESTNPPDLELALTFLPNELVRFEIWGDYHSTETFSRLGNEIFFSDGTDRSEIASEIFHNRKLYYENGVLVSPGGTFGAVRLTRVRQ